MQYPPIPEIAGELKTALDAAREAAKAVLEIYGGEFTHHTKDDDSPITEADLASNEIIKSRLSKTPHRILSEEDRDDHARLDEDAIWIVDPLDGTSDFVEKTGEFTVMIALVRDKVPVLGVIAWPTGGTLYTAQKNFGAFRDMGNGWERIAVSNTKDISQCRIVGSRHHLAEKDKSFINSLGTKGFQSVGSSLKAARISCGDAEAYITTANKIKEWDTAASHCILTEAGGRMTDMLGHDITYNNRDVCHKDGILATNGTIHDEILARFAGLD